MTAKFKMNTAPTEGVDPTTSASEPQAVTEKQPTVTPEPAADPDAESESEDGENAAVAENGEATSTDTKTPSSAKSRKGRRIIAVAVICGIGFVIAARSFGASPIDASVRANLEQATTSNSTIPAAIPASAALAVNIDDILNAAATYQVELGTFVGFSHETALVATATNTIIVSATVGETCLYSGIIDGTRNAVLLDPTGSACDVNLVSQAQQSLDATASEVVADSDLGVSDSVNAIIDAANLWTQMTFDPTTGAPNLHGFMVPFPGAVVEQVDPSGSFAAVRVTSGASCTIVVVFADVTMQAQQSAC